VRTRGAGRNEANRMGAYHILVQDRLRHNRRHVSNIRADHHGATVGAVGYGRVVVRGEVAVRGNFGVWWEEEKRRGLPACHGVERYLGSVLVVRLREECANQVSAQIK
jgi:hypothetical protein